MKRFFLSRKTVLTFITLILCSVVLSYVIPQRFSVAAITLQKWREGNPFPARIVGIAGLDHIYTTPWFAMILGLFLTSLCLSTIQQFSLARQKTFQRLSPSTGDWVTLSGSEGEAQKIIRKSGYLKLAVSDGAARFVKHPWGYWGSFMLHLGFVVVVASSVVILFTQKSGLIRAEEGEVFLPGAPWSAESHGLMAERLVLPAAVNLRSLEVHFWETDDIRQIQSTLAFVHPDGISDEVRVGINEPVWYRGMKLYQAFETGDTFYLEFTDQNGRRTAEALMFQLPLKRDRASYNEFQFGWLPFRIKAKYYADAERRTMVGRNPLLVLRLYEGVALRGELPLKVGESGQLGSYQVRLVKTGRWTGIIFNSLTGMPGIFCGFFIIILGAGIIYFTPPRVIFIRREETGFSLLCKAERFGKFYQDEFERIVEALGAKRL
jgi:hypothetical protein